MRCSACTWRWSARSGCWWAGPGGTAKCCYAAAPPCRSRSRYRRRMRASIVALLALCAACDSKATASDPQATARPEQKSKEYESCGASMHCADELRCFDQTCRRTARSAVGDYFAALGSQARAKGDNEAAIAAYTSALGHYDSEHVPLPPDIDCAYGGALAAAKTNRDHAELGARVLHRCLLAVPTASSLRVQALSELATLSDVGLDP